MNFFRSLRDERTFYAKVLRISVPIMVQSGITNFVSLLDNIMIGRVDTLQMTGVSIVNQLINIFYLCIFGAVSGAGIFTSQFVGKADHSGVRQTFRYKLYACVLLTLLGSLIIGIFRKPLISLYLNGEGSAADKTAALFYGLDYLRVMLFGLLPYAFSQVYASTLRENGETVLPMKAAAVAVFVNLVGNYILIYGKFGAPAMGATGAAISTVLSRFVEITVLAVWTHTHTNIMPFADSAYSSFHVERCLVRDITVKGTPLMLNETLWSAGMAMLTQCYSMRSIDAIASLNIVNTIGNMFLVTVIAMGNTIGIILGQLMGANRMDEARSSCMNLAWFSVSMGFICGGLMAVCAPLFPLLYNTTPEVRDLAAKLIIIFGCCLPIHAFVNSSYFTLRSGGKTLLTFLFDSVYVWIVTVPLAFCLIKFTVLQLPLIYIICNGIDLIKCAAGRTLMKKGIWLNNVIDN